MGYKPGNHVRSEYLVFLAAVFVVYLAVSSYWMWHLVTRVGEIEHQLEHSPGRHLEHR